MSSRRWLALLVAFPLGCAGFSRGEYWHDSEDGTGAAGEDGVDDGADDDGPGPGPDDDGADDGGSTDGGESGGSDAGSDGAPEGPTFQTDVLPLLRAGCERCHASDGDASDTDFLLDDDDDAAYDTTLDQIDLDAPASSRLLAKTAGKGHTGGVIYSDHSPQYAIMLDWIERGAPP